MFENNAYCHLTYKYQVSSTVYFSDKYDLVSNFIDKLNNIHPWPGFKVGDEI